MKPYHQTEHGSLYLGDCLQVMQCMEDKSVDLAICDFPYDICSGGDSFMRNRKYFKNIMSTGLSDGFSSVILEVLHCKLKNHNGYYFCNKNQLKQYLDYAHDNNLNFDLLSWHKNNPSPLCNNNFLPDTEFIMFMRDIGVKLNVTYKTARRYFISDVEKNNIDHPTVKPLFIIERLIHNSSVDGDVIIDPTCGSGTTGVSCIRCKRKYILIEKEEKYCEICAKRITAELEQTDIFRGNNDIYM